MRPESVVIGTDADRVSTMDNRITGDLISVLFNGANSRALIRDRQTGGELDVALPQTGEFSHLKRGQEVHLGWGMAQAKAFAAPNGAPAQDDLP